MLGGHHLATVNAAGAVCAWGLAGRGRERQPMVAKSLGGIGDLL